MSVSTARAPQFRFTIAVVTADELLRGDAAAILADTYALLLPRDCTELGLLLKKQRLDAVLLDLDGAPGPSDDNIGALQKLRSIAPDLVLAALTRSSSRKLRLQAVEASLDEYFAAPIDFREIDFVLCRALEKRGLEIETRSHRSEPQEQQCFCDLIGGSDPMQRVYAAIARVAESVTTVLIRGESGTGKELAARAIVARGPRAAKPFISINCAALPDNLIETELFGHEKGAFTDARTSRAGHIEQAHTGTLFLDEIATLGLALQAKLLRVLEDRAVTRIGGNLARKIDFRLITATNENLEDMVHSGRFREDLYYRINVIPITLPPLRDRTGDIPVLVNHFLRAHSAANRIPTKQLEPEVLEILEDYSWPGNVRELENLVQRLVLMVDGPVIMATHLPQQILVTSTASQEALLIPEQGVNFEEEMARIETAYVNAALRRSGGSKIGAARLLQMDKQKMHYLCRKYGIGRE